DLNAVSTSVPTVGQISTNSTNTFSAVGPSNTAVSPTRRKSSYMDPSQYPDDPNMPALEDNTYSDDEEDVGAEADFTNLETTITVSPIPTTRVHKDHPVTQIISDLSTATPTRSRTRMVKDQEPKRVHQALKDPSRIEAMQEELLQFKMQKDDVEEPTELQEVIEVVTTAKLMTEVVTAATTTITAATPIIAATIIATPGAVRRIKGVVIRDPEETDAPSIIIHTEPESKDKGKGIMVEEPKPLKKQTQIEQDEAYARELEAELNKNINWDNVIEQVKEKGKQDNAVLRYQALERKPHTEAQARKNMIVYLKNMAGFKMDYFKRMSYDDIRPIFEKALKRQRESLEEKAAKKQKLDEEVEELKKHLQIVPNDDDDVYTEATPLALKVPVVDYEIYSENNKPFYKIIRADGSHQIFLSFLSLLRNFDREDLEMLWQIVQERFSSSKPKNFSDVLLLTTLQYMFEKPDVEAQV
nr:hypothetical protein [Tanacetum cinerariifolium]